MYNNRGPADARRVFTGKDGMLFSEDGTLLATIETFQGQINVTNATYQPLGDAQEHHALATYSVTLTFTNCLVEDSSFFQELINMTTAAQPLMWTFQGVVKGRNGSEERIIYRDCVPDGNIDLQNITVGDLIKRQWSLFVNRPPELQKLLSYSD
nr:MAG TPA: hypothetical protein [Caudoviricetes sp.]